MSVFPKENTHLEGETERGRERESEGEGERERERYYRPYFSWRVIVLLDALSRTDPVAENEAGVSMGLVGWP
jgi:hypothetical protein